MPAQNAFVRPVQKPEQRQGDQIDVVNLPDKRENVRNKIERNDHVNDRRRKQGLFRHRNLRVGQKPADQLDHIRQKHQKIAHPAFQFRPFPARRFFCFHFLRFSHFFSVIRAPVFA
jgi:hypothetical protein